jgi:F-type H+-transporting ATPase subunit b
MRISFGFQLALVLGLLAGLSMAAAPAFADAPKEAGASGAHKEKEGEKEKDPTAFMGIKSYDLAIWTLVVFGLLIFILGRYAWGPVMQGLQKREDAITQARSDAEMARGEAQKLLDEVKAQRAKANEEAAGILAEARKDADAFREAEKARTAADIQADRDRLKREIETARDQALQDIWARTVELASLVSTKAVRRELSVDDHRRLIDEALSELKQNVGKA